LVHRICAEPHLVLGVDVSLSLEQQCHGINVSSSGRYMQCRALALVAAIDVCTSI
jgi:hypothetical protein